MISGRPRVCFEPRDIWIGVYWDRTFDGIAFYVCLLPCLPIMFHLKTSDR